MSQYCRPEAALEADALVVGAAAAAAAGFWLVVLTGF